MASAIFFSGRRINIPQAVSRVDASGLAATSPASSGIVAIVGQAEGGLPLTVDESASDATQATVIQSRYRSGELRTAALFAFQPSSDDAVPGGAQKVIAVKVNPSTQGQATLPDSNLNSSIIITAKDSGLFTSQINLEIAPGTDLGQKVTVHFEDKSETFDDLGGSPIFDVLYTPGASGYGTALGSISASQFLVRASKAAAGLSAQRLADIPVPGTVQVVSSNAGDTTQKVTVYGLTIGPTFAQETIALNGTTPVLGLQAFSRVFAVVMSGVAVGTVLVKDNVIPTTLFTLAPAVLSRGYLATTNTPANGVATVSIDVDTAVFAVVLGLDAVGAQVSQIVDLTTAHTVPIVGTTVFASITAVLLGDVAGARTVTVAIDAVKTQHTTFSTVQKVVDRLNTLAGFAANADVSNPSAFLMVDADFNQAPTRPAVSLLVDANFYADVFVIRSVLTTQSQYVNVARATPGQLPPSNTVAPIYLAGGGEGVTTITQWQQAFALLRKRRYNTLVPLTRDPAILALALAHMLEKNSTLKSECNAYLGLGKTDGSGETRTNIQSQILSLQGRHCSFISQEVEKFDPLTGVATFFPPYMLAAVAAGMQAGSAIAEPLTHKTFIATNIRNDPSWSVADDASDLIDRGLMMAEKQDNIGIRWIRSITGWVADDNPVFSEMSACESLDHCVFNLRTALEKKIGGRGLPGTVGALYSLATSELNRQKTSEEIFDFKSLQIDQVGDVFPVSVEVAPIGPVNFISITVYLTLAQAQAA